MAGWGSANEAWDRAKTVADELGLTTDDLLDAGRRYMREQWPEGDSEDPQQLQEAVAAAEMLRLLRPYLEDIQATKE